MLKALNVYELFWGQYSSMDEKWIKKVVALKSTGTQQASATESIKEAIDHLLDYLATYPNYVIVYRARNIVLAAHSDAGFHNESKGRIWSVSQIFLAEDEPVPQWNGTILTIYQVIKFIMLSEAKAEIGALFVAAEELVPMCQTLI